MVNWTHSNIKGNRSWLTSFLRCREANLIFSFSMLNLVFLLRVVFFNRIILLVPSSHSDRLIIHRVSTPNDLSSHFVICAELSNSHYFSVVVFSHFLKITILSRLCTNYLLRTLPLGTSNTNNSAPKRPHVCAHVYDVIPYNFLLQMIKEDKAA